jgi:hypothetical protein
MIDQFVGFCLRHRIPIIVLAILLGGFGVYAWLTLSVEVYPTSATSPRSHDADAGARRRGGRATIWSRPPSTASRPHSPAVAG